MLPSETRLRTRAGRRDRRGRRPARWALLGAAALAALPAAAPAASTQEQLDRARARERALSSDVAAFSGLMSRLDGDIGVLEQRRSALAVDLAAQQAQLDRTQRELRRDRARLAALRRRLAHSRRVLSLRLIELYKSERPDLVSVVLTSRGFIDLLERGEFMRRIGEQDQRVIRGVRADRNATAIAATRLARLQDRQRSLAATIAAERDNVAGTQAALARKRAGYAQAVAARQSSLRSTRADRGRLESQMQRRLATLQTAHADAGALSPSSGWAIPWSIVNCESGGRNWSPNGAGASGYYQIIPSTWKGFGGRGPAAHLAPKSEQDRVAAQIYRGGAGASNWVCAGR